MCKSCLREGLSRRSLLVAGALLAAGPLILDAAQAQPASAADTPDAALKLLTEGNERYVANQPGNGIFLLDARVGLLVKLHSQQF